MLQSHRLRELARKDLNLLLLFKAIAETGSVSKAADQLALSQPATSHALNRLRGSLNDPLFVRSKTGLSPTPLAQSLIAPISAVLAQIDQIFNLPQFDPASEQRRFHIATSDFTAATLSPRILQKFAQIAPLVSLDFHAIQSQTFAQLETGAIELLLAVLPEPPQQFRTIELLRDRFVVVAQRQHPLSYLAQKRKITLTEYLYYPHISVNFSEAIKNQIDAQLAILGRQRHIRATFASFISGLNSLHGSDMLMSLPAQLGKPFIETFDLVQFELPFALEAQPYYLIWHKRTDHDSGLQWLRKEICEQFGVKYEQDES